MLMLMYPIRWHCDESRWSIEFNGQGLGRHTSPCHLESHLGGVWSRAPWAPWPQPFDRWPVEPCHSWLLSPQTLHLLLAPGWANGTRWLADAARLAPPLVCISLGLDLAMCWLSPTPQAQGFSRVPCLTSHPSRFFPLVMILRHLYKIHNFSVSLLKIIPALFLS